MDSLHDSKPDRTSGNLRDYMTKWIEGLEKLLEERDLRYSERFRAQEMAVSAALAAQKELNNTTVAASEKAITKAEDAQRDYNQRSNEFRGALDDQNKIMARDMLSRKEYEGNYAGTIDKIDTQSRKYDEKFEDLKKEVAFLREAKSATEGRVIEKAETRVENRWSTGVMVSVFFSATATIISIILLVLKLVGK